MSVALASWEVGCVSRSHQGVAHERARPDSLNLTMTVSDVKHRFPMTPAAFLAAATAITLAYGFVPYGKNPGHITPLSREEY